MDFVRQQAPSGKKISKNEKFSNPIKDFLSAKYVACSQNRGSSQRSILFFLCCLSLSIIGNVYHVLEKTPGKCCLEISSSF